MYRYIIALIPAVSLATGKPPAPTPVAPPSAVSESSSTSVSHSNSISSSSSMSHSGDSAANNSLTVNSTRNAPAVIAAAVYPTAGCQAGFGIGGSGVNGGGLVNFSFTKKECEKVVLAQNFAAIGMPDTACKILATTKAFKRAGIKVDCTPAPIPVAALPDMGQYVKREELIERDKRIVEAVTKK